MSTASVFLISFLLHSFIGWRIVFDLAAISVPLAAAVSGALFIFALLMPVGLLAKRVAPAALAQFLTWLGLLCMGLFSTLLILTLAREAVWLLMVTVNLLWPASFAVATLREDSALSLPIVAFVITAFGFWNARRTAAIVRVNVPIANLAQALHGFTVAQISDIHIGPTIKTHYLQRIVERVNLLGANMVAITGDLVDGSVNELRQHVAPLAQLQSTHGTFFVTGNHEYYSGAQAWIKALRSLGITVLMNEHVLINHSGLVSVAGAADSGLMLVAGVTDFTAHHFEESHRSDPHAAVANAPNRAEFKLLLAHQPRSAFAAADAGFDLQLSGHTHGGQFWPWMYFVKFQQPFIAGLHKLQSMWVYTSRGTGYWGPPKRFGAPSEITLLRLVRI